VRVALAPVVGNGICKDASGLVKSCCADGTTDLWVPLQSVLCILVPEVKGTVASCSAEGSVYRVEVDRVHRVDVGCVSLVGYVLTMTLETEVRAGILLFDVLNSASAFYATDGESSRVGKAGYGSGLPLEGALKLLVEFRWLSEVNDVDPSLCSTNDEHLILDVHTVDTILTFQSSSRCLLAQVPVFDCLIPRSCHEHGVSADRDTLDAANRLVVCGNLLRCGRV